METRKYATMLAVVQEHLAGHDDTARALLADLVDRQLDAERPEDMPFYIFASALSRRLASDKAAEINLYLRRFERTQISLFNLLAEHLPTVRMAGPLANEVIARFVTGGDALTLLDVGIGSGRQEVELLRLLARRGTLPRHVNVIAIEPDAGSLIEADDALTQTARAVGITLTLHPVHKVVEALDDADWAEFAALGGPVIVLGSFAVHHVQSRHGTDGRLDLFRRLRALDPTAVVLAEPSSDHDAGDLAVRFQAAWHHFGQNFRMIDGLSVDAAQKAAMKMFFAREIEDIVANAEDSRCERHEPVDHWVRRFREAGFTPCTDLEVPHGGETGDVTVRAHEGYLGLDLADETLVAILCAIPAVPAARDGADAELVEQMA